MTKIERCLPLTGVISSASTRLVRSHIVKHTRQKADMTHLLTESRALFALDAITGKLKCRMLKPTVVAELPRAMACNLAAGGFFATSGLAQRRETDFAGDMLPSRFRCGSALHCEN